MKIFPSLVLLLLACPLVFTQNTFLPHDRVSFKITPTSMFNPNTATVLLGAEVRPVEKIGLQFEYGLKFNELALMSWNTEKKDWQYARYKGELRWYPLPFDEISVYMGAGLLVVPQRYTKSPGFVRLNDTDFRYDSSRITRDAWAVFINFGAKWHLDRHFFIEFYGGCGFKKLTIEHQFTGLTEVDVLPLREWFSQRDEREGSWNLPFIDAGLKLGVSFSERIE